MEERVLIHILPEGQCFAANRGETLLMALRRAGVAFDAPCGGRGTCGKCRVILTENGKEREALACQIVIETDLTLRIPSPAAEMRILTQTRGGEHSAPSGGSPALAFDVGTTTVAAYLVDSLSGAELASAAAMNPQSVFGADVIARLSYAMEHGESALTKAVKKTLCDLTELLCKKANVRPESIHAACAVGNTAMQHLLLGLPVDTLARAPFQPADTAAFTVSARAFGLPVAADAKLLVPPVIAGFVGADTVACLVDTGIEQAKSPTMLIDIGTNGELVLSHGGRCTACSTAAGPAFEGARIEMGLRAEAGAIDSVSYAGEIWRITTIGGAPPRGVCGSGLLDAAAALLDAGLITASGRLLPREDAADHPLINRLFMHGGKTAFLVSTADDGGEAFITQQDIRELQLAKGAIRAGIELLAKDARLSISDISRVIMAGAFGCYLNARSALKIGLFPAAFSGRIEHAGNAAGGGAKKLVSDGDAFRYAEALARRTRHLELEKQADFLDVFMDAMAFNDQ